MDKIVRWLLVWMVVCGAAHAQLLTGLGQANLPLSGNELAYIVQGGVSKQTPVNSFYSASTCSLVAGCTFTGAVSFGSSGTGLAVTNNATVGGTLGVTGATTLGGGGTLTGTFTGTPTFSGDVTLSGSGTGLAVTNGVSLGSLTSNTSTLAISDPNGTTAQIIDTVGAATVHWPILQPSNSGGAATLWTNLGNLNLAANGSSIVNVPSNVLQFGKSLNSNNQTITLSGATPMTPLVNFGGNPAGSSTVAGDTANNLVAIGSNADSMSTSTGALNYFAVLSQMASGWNGSRDGVLVQLQASNSTTCASAATCYLVGMSPTVIGDANFGGTSSGFGTTSHGLGNIFGGTDVARLTSNATYFHSVVSHEFDVLVQSGASVASEVGIQIVHENGHAVQGTNESYAFLIGDQSGVTATWRSDLEIGGYNGGPWPLSSTGYILQAVNPGIGTTPTAAGGIDLRQPSFTGTGLEGGGFAYRWNGGEIDPGSSGGIAQIGYGSIAGVSGGMTIDATYSKMTSAAVQSGGTGFTANDLLTDAYGDVVAVNGVSGGVVSTVTIINSGWQPSGSTPSNPVTFNARSYNGSGYGSGLTLNLTWTAQTGLNLGTGSAVAIGIGNSGSTTTITGTIKAGSSTGQSQTCTVNQAKTLIFTNGILTGGTCNS